MKTIVGLSEVMNDKEIADLKSLLDVERKAGAIKHLNDLHKFRLSGQISVPADNWLEIEIHELERDIVRGEVFGV